jgi:DNA modification methylase
MTRIKTETILTGKIREGRRVRTDLGDVDGLAESIKSQGQLAPIVVTIGHHNGTYDLVIGARRLRACKKLGIKVRAEILDPPEAIKRLEMELHENLRRKGFDLAEESEGLARLKALKEEVSPETKVGATGSKVKGKDKDGKPVVEVKTKSDIAGPAKPEAKRFTLEAAEALGCSERKVQSLLAVQNLPPKRLEKALKDCTTTAERNRAVKKLEREVRQEEQVAKLQKRAQANRQQTIDDAGRPKIHLHHGDCFELMVGEDLVDLVCADPEYGRKRSLIRHTDRKDIAEDVDWDQLDIGWVLKVAPMIRPGGQLLAFCPLEAIGSYEVAMEAAGLIYKVPYIWCKTNPGTAHRKTPIHATEAIVWAVRPGAVYYFEDFATQAGGEALNWITGPICQGSERLAHPTQKPEWLITKLIQRHSAEGSNVLDPFAGVGTTGAVCMDLKRGCTMIEEEAKYVKLARLRLQARRAA